GTSAGAGVRPPPSPIRSDVKLPGPVPTTIRPISFGSASAPVSSASTSSSTRAGTPVLSPSTLPSSSSALVATFVAVSNASVSTVALDQAPVLAGMSQQDMKSRRGQRVAGSLRPLDEADRSVEIRLEIAPLGRRDALESIEVEMRDIYASTVPMTNREGGAGNGPGHAQSAACPSHERRVLGAQLRPHQS